MNHLNFKTEARRCEAAALSRFSSSLSKPPMPISETIGMGVMKAGSARNDGTVAAKGCPHPINLKKIPKAFHSSHAFWRGFWYCKSARGKSPMDAERAASGFKWNWYMHHHRTTPLCVPSWLFDHHKHSTMNSMHGSGSHKHDHSRFPDAKSGKGRPTDVYGNGSASPVLVSGSSQNTGQMLSGPFADHNGKMQRGGGSHRNNQSGSTISFTDLCGSEGAIGSGAVIASEGGSRAHHAASSKRTDPAIGMDGSVAYAVQSAPDQISSGNPVIGYGDRSKIAGSGAGRVTGSGRRWLFSAVDDSGGPRPSAIVPDSVVAFFSSAIQARDILEKTGYGKQNAFSCKAGGFMPQPHGAGRSGAIKAPDQKIAGSDARLVSDGFISGSFARKNLSGVSGGSQRGHVRPTHFFCKTDEYRRIPRLKVAVDAAMPE